MKITKRQLRRIIKEASAGVGEKLQFHAGPIEWAKKPGHADAYGPRPATVTKREPTEFVGKNGQPMEMVTVEYDDKIEGKANLNAPEVLSLVPQGMSVAELISKDGHVMNRRKDGFPQIFPVKLAPGEESGDPEYDRIRVKAANKEYSHPEMVYNEPYERRKKNKRDKAAAAKAAAAKDPQMSLPGVTESKGRKMKITKRQLRRIIKEEKAKLLREGLDPYDINANMGTEFFLSDENGTFDASGDLLNPADLRQLADTLEKLFSGAIQPDGMVGFDID